MTEKRKRARYTKSTTGCITCRIRRVKCDETKPACRRCTSTGRCCDGYPERRIVIVQQKPTAKPTNPPPQVEIGALSWLPRCEEAYAFAHYLRRTGPHFSGALDEGLWDSLMPQYAHDDVAVRYGLLAMSHLARNPFWEHTNGQVSEIRIAPQHERGLNWHRRAILTDQQLKPTSNSAILLKTVLFSTLEFMMNNFQAGLRVMSIGFSLLGHYITAGLNRCEGQQPEVDEITKNVFPIGLRAACLLFTPVPEKVSATNSYNLDLDISQALCGMYSNLKNAYFLRKANAMAAIQRMISRVQIGHTRLISLRLQALKCNVIPRCQRHSALVEYCDVALSWAEFIEHMLQGREGPPESDLTAILKQVTSIKQRSRESYPHAVNSAFFHEIIVLPPAYFVAIFARDTALRNEALELMHYPVVPYPEIQLYAVIMSLEGEIPQSDEMFQSLNAAKIYDLRDQPPLDLSEPQKEEDFFLASNGRGKTFVDIFCCGDMNGVYASCHQYIRPMAPLPLMMDRKGNSDMK